LLLLFGVLVNFNLKSTLLSIFFAFVLIASSLFLAQPVQSQLQLQYVSLTNSVLNDIQRNMPPLTQPSQAPPSQQQQQQPQQGQDIGNDFVRRWNQQIYHSGQAPSRAQPIPRAVPPASQQRSPGGVPYAGTTTYTPPTVQNNQGNIF
jgi:hypothetical protein